MGHIKLWGASQTPDAVVLVEDFDGTNRNIPLKNIVLAYNADHIVEIQRCKYGYKGQSGVEYFAENYYEITVGVSRDLMELWPIQKEALRFFQNNQRVVMNAARQTSKSTLIRLYTLWTLCFSDDQQAIGMLANKFTTAKKSLKELKRAYEALPLFIKPAVRQTNESLFSLENNNLIRIESTNADALRGDTLTSLIIDEAAFINRGKTDGLDEEIMQSLLPTLDAAGDKSFCILISTPYGRNNVFAKLYHNSKDDVRDKRTGKPVTPFKHFEMLWSDHPARDDAWYIKTLSEMGHEKFAIEFGGSFDLGSGLKKIIDAPVRDFMVDNCIQDPIMTQNWDLSVIDDLDDQSLKIWELPQEGHIYTAGSDIAEGTGNCDSTVEIFDITDLYDIRQVAEYKNNEITTPDYTLVCLKLFNTYNGCFAGVEGNNVGREVLEPLVKTHNYTNLYQIRPEKGSHQAMIKKGEYGFWSHNNTKKEAVTNARYFLNTRKCVTIRSKELLRQMDSFVPHKGKNNNVNWAAENSSVKDDLVDAFNIALSGLHNKYVESYFTLTDPKFDSHSKPIKIAKQRKINKRDGMTININIDQTFISVYTNDSVGQPPADNWDWLNSF